MEKLTLFQLRSKGALLPAVVTGQLQTHLPTPEKAVY